MARRRRVNKKVAVIGAAVSLLFALAAVFVILRLNQDPAPFRADGDAAWARKDYRTARENYSRAYGLTKSSEDRIDLLFKVADAYRELGQWDKVVGCWNQVVTFDPQNVKARLGQLRYIYTLADSLDHAGQNVSDHWQEALSQAGKAIVVVEKANLLNDERAKWEPSFGAVEDRAGARRLGPYLHFVKGRAALELAGMGAVASPGELLQEARSDLQEAGRLDPNDAQVYRHLAEVLVEESKIAAARGDVSRKDEAEKQADEILAEGLRAAGNVPEAHISVLSRKLAVAQRTGIGAVREQMKALESEYENLTQRFATSPQVFAAQAQFYSFYAAYLDSAGAAEKLNRAIEASEQAHALDRGSVEYLILAAGCRYRQFSVYGDVSALHKALELTERALKLPGAQDTAGPVQFANRVNRLRVCDLLARCCVERIFALSKSDPAREGLLARLEQAVHQIGQIHGSAENPDVLKWRGMLDLARGETDQAVRSLYAAYEQAKAAHPPDQRDAFLSYTLAKIFEGTSETGAVIEFLGTALNSWIVHTKPDALLDYASAFLKVGSYDVVLSAAGSFEERFGQNDRSRVLRLKALIAKGHLAEAQEGLGRLNSDDPNTVLLSLDLIRARTSQLLATIQPEEHVGWGLPHPEPEAGGSGGASPTLRGYLKREAELVRRLLQIDPNAVEEMHVAELCEMLVAQSEPGAARTVVDAFLNRSPDNATALFYRGLVSEPDPRKCPPSRRREIREQAVRGIADPVRRSLELGLLYQQDEPDQAVAQLRSVLDATASQGVRHTPVYLRAGLLSPRHVAAGCLFDLARRQENWPLAQEVAEIAKRENLDDCGGHLFAARLAIARKEYGRALSRLDEGLKQRPIFSYGYMLRSDVRAALGKEQESIEDARKAASLNPADPVVAKTLVRALHVRNGKLCGNLTSEQTQETRQALERAIRLNPRDTSLLVMYVDFISEPEKAIALRQTIQRNAPSLDNAVQLGKLAKQAALKETDEKKKQAFLAIAQAAFAQAGKIDPAGQSMLDNCTQHAAALDDCRKQLATAPDSLAANFALFNLAGAQGRYDEAVDCIDKCIRLSGPETDRGLQYGVHKAHLLTLAYDRTSDKVYLQRAIAAYESLRVKWPKNSSVLNNLAYLLAQSGERLAEALEYARTATESDPSEAGYLDTYAYVLHKNGRPAEAAQSLAAAMQRYEVRGAVPAEAYEHLGMVSEALGERSKARDAYRRALEAGGAAMPEAVQGRISAAIERLTR